MFTGIITAIGTITHVETHANADTVLRVEGAYPADGIAIGASICHSGVCLTVIEKGATDDGGAWWTVQVSEESLSKTTLGIQGIGVGSKVNLERALKAGDELGGHIVAGHVDVVGEVVSVITENESHRVRIRVPKPFHKLVAPKGSVAIEGVSLTVNEVDDDVFGINVIPHTWNVTTLGSLTPGAAVNLEADPLARYVARLLDITL
jgi:riboflavin synthase